MDQETKLLMTEKEVNESFPLKVELHVHLEGAVRFNTILDLASETGIKLPTQTLSELKDYVCIRKAEDLTSALENIYIYAPTFAGYHEGVYRIAYELCEDAAASGTRYIEIRYSPHFLSNSLGVQTYAASTNGSYAPRDVVGSVNEALADASRDLDITAKSILCCIRHHPEWSNDVVELCSEFCSQGVVAMDIAGPEIGTIVTDTDQSHHLAAYKEARRRGIQCIAHAGEVGPADIVKMSLDELGAARIGHGYRCLEDESLYLRMLKSGIHLEVCPISSLLTGGAPSGKINHPVVRFAQDNANFSISTDDPTLFDSCLAQDYVCAMELGLTKQQLTTSIFNAARSCFGSQREKEALLKELRTVYGDF